MISYGLYVICEYDDGFQEPEGIVIFDTLEPPLGTVVKLSDGKDWVVTKNNMKKEYNPHIVVHKKTE